MSGFEEGLGQVMHVAGALEYRPFLGPLYKFMSPRPRDSVSAVPPHMFLSSSDTSQKKSLSAGSTIAQ